MPEINYSPPQQNTAIRFNRDGTVDVTTGGESYHLTKDQYNSTLPGNKNYGNFDDYTKQYVYNREYYSNPQFKLEQDYNLAKELQYGATQSQAIQEWAKQNSQNLYTGIVGDYVKNDAVVQAVRDKLNNPNLNIKSPPINETRQAQLVVQEYRQKLIDTFGKDQGEKVFQDTVTSIQDDWTQKNIDYNAGRALNYTNLDYSTPKPNIFQAIKGSIKAELAAAGLGKGLKLDPDLAEQAKVITDKPIMSAKDMKDMYMLSVKQDQRDLQRASIQSQIEQSQNLAPYKSLGIDVKLPQGTYQKIDYFLGGRLPKGLSPSEVASTKEAVANMSARIEMGKFSDTESLRLAGGLSNVPTYFTPNKITALDIEAREDPNFFTKTAAKIGPGAFDTIVWGTETAAISGATWGLGTSFNILGPASKVPVLKYLGPVGTTFIGAGISESGQQNYKAASKWASQESAKMWEEISLRNNLPARKEALQNQFESKYGEAIRRGETTPAKALKEFKKTEDYKNYQSSLNRSQTFGEGLKGFGLSLVPIVLPTSRTGVVLTGLAPSIWKSLPSTARLGVQGYTAFTQAPKAFNTTLSAQERIQGGVFGGLSAYGFKQDFPTWKIGKIPVGEMALGRLERAAYSVGGKKLSWLGVRQPVTSSNVKFRTDAITGEKIPVRVRNLDPKVTPFGAPKQRATVIIYDGKETVVVEGKNVRGQFMTIGGGPTIKGKIRDLTFRDTAYREAIEETGKGLSPLRGMKSQLRYLGTETTGSVESHIYGLKVDNVRSLVSKFTPTSDVKAFKVIKISSLDFKDPGTLTAINQPRPGVKGLLDIYRGGGYRRDAAYILTKYLKGNPASTSGGFSVRIAGGSRPITDYFYNPKVKDWVFVGRDSAGRIRQTSAKYNVFKDPLTGETIKSPVAYTGIDITSGSTYDAPASIVKQYAGKTIGITSGTPDAPLATKKGNIWYVDPSKISRGSYLYGGPQTFVPTGGKFGLRYIGANYLGLGPGTKEIPKIGFGERGQRSMLQFSEQIGPYQVQKSPGMFGFTPKDFPRATGLITEQEVGAKPGTFMQYLAGSASGRGTEVSNILGYRVSNTYTRIIPTEIGLAAKPTIMSRIRNIFEPSRQAEELKFLTTDLPQVTSTSYKATFPMLLSPAGLAGSTASISKKVKITTSLPSYVPAQSSYSLSVPKSVAPTITEPTRVERSPVAPSGGSSGGGGSSPSTPSIPVNPEIPITPTTPSRPTPIRTRTTYYPIEYKTSTTTTLTPGIPVQKKKKKFEQKKGKGREKGFLVFTFKNKKPVLISQKPLIKSQAIGLGVRYTKQTERASFKLVPTTQAPVRSDIKGLKEQEVWKLGYRRPVRKGKVQPFTDVFIQRRPTRMSNKREVKSIQSYLGRGKSLW